MKFLRSRVREERSGFYETGYIQQVEDASPSPSLLCLHCQKTGHVLPNCPLLSTVEDLEVEPPKIVAASGLCQRCHELNLPALLEGQSIDFNDTPGFKGFTGEGTDFVAVLRLEPDFPLKVDCASCRLICAAYTRKEDHPGKCVVFHVIRACNRIPASEIGVSARTALEKLTNRHQFACYLRGVTDPYGYMKRNQTEEPVETFGLLPFDASSRTQFALAPRLVGSRSVDFSRAKKWIEHCRSQHSEACQPTKSSQLRSIKLIDVYENVLVSYPAGNHFDYLALSYVCGRVAQDYNIEDGRLPHTLPATLSDAFLVVKQLGKRYLWVDSICIDQKNDAQKAEQIGIMDAIYSGAYATIINLSGADATSGIARVGSTAPRCSQIVEKVGTRRIVSLMPTLQEYLKTVIWNTRAWTFQECVLSPRRLFFTEHQLYFACNQLQCCESIDETFLNRQDSTGNNPLNEAERTTVITNPFVQGRMPTSLSRTMALYVQLIMDYTCRHMTLQTDALAALTGLFQRFQQNKFLRAFLYGLPVDQFRAGLMWVHCERGTDFTPHRRNAFPSWSWLEWQGQIH